MLLVAEVTDGNRKAESDVLQPSEAVHILKLGEMQNSG